MSWVQIPSGPFQKKMEEDITLEEIQKTKPKGIFYTIDQCNQIFLKLKDGTEKLVVCDCGNDFFEKRGAIFYCTSCNKKITMAVIEKEFY